MLKRLAGSLGTCISALIGVAYPASAAVMYWADNSLNNIYRANLDGSGMQIVFSGHNGVGGLAIDTVNGHLYWTEPSTGGAQSGQIRRSNLDGSSVITILSGLDSPRGIGLDLSNNNIYWSLSSNVANVQRSNLDGTSPENLVGPVGTQPYGMYVDTLNHNIYWTESSGTLAGVKRAELDGSNTVNIVSGIFGFGLDVDLSNANIYFVSKAGPDAIVRTNFLGTSIVNLVSAADLGLDSIGAGGIAVDPTKVLSG